MDLGCTDIVGGHHLPGTTITSLPDIFSLECSGDCLLAVARRYGQGGQILERWRVEDALALSVAADEAPPVPPERRD